jgi:hypothetical protein
MTLYNFSMVPQRLYQNPAFIPETQVYIGIPCLSGVRTAVANPFSYHRILVRTDDDSLSFQGDEVVEGLEQNPYVRTYESIELVSVGAHFFSDRYFLNFGIRQRSAGDVYIPAELAYLAWYGNTAPQIFGKTVNIAPSVNAMAYDEWSASVAGYALQNRLTWGVAFKFLMGRISINTKKSKMDFYTDSTTYDLYVKSDFEVNTSGIENIEEYFNQPVSVLVFPENIGLGIDLGATFQVNGKISVSASVTDIGYIRWRANTMKLVSKNPGEEVKYTGMTMDDFVEMFDDFDEFGKKITDSLADLIEIDSVYDVNYTTSLPARFNAGGSYAIDDANKVNLVVNGISYNHHFSAALGISYNYTFRQLFGIAVSYNLYNHQYTNFGLGFNINAGPVQVYAVTDNLPGLMFWKATNNSSLQFGINIVLNRGEKLIQTHKDPGV